MVKIKEHYQPLTSRKPEILLYLTNIKLHKTLDLWVFWLLREIFNKTYLDIMLQLE